MPDRSIPRTICPAYWFGEVVFLKVADDPECGMVTKITILPNDCYLFTISWADGNDSAHYDFELAAEPVLAGD